MVILSNSEKIVLAKTIAFLGFVCNKVSAPKLMNKLLYAIGEEDLRAGLSIVDALEKLSVRDGDLELESGDMLFQFLNNAFINIGQFHKGLQKPFEEFVKLEEEEAFKRREWFAVECAEKLIEPELLEELKPVMIKLRGRIQ